MGLFKRAVDPLKALAGEEERYAQTNSKFVHNKFSLHGSKGTSASHLYHKLSSGITQEASAATRHSGVHTALGKPNSEHFTNPFGELNFDQKVTPLL